MNFLTKLGLTAAVSALITGPITGIVIFYYSKDIVIERIVNEKRLLAEQMMLTIHALVERAANDTRMIASDELLRNHFQTAATSDNAQMLRRELEERSELTGPWIHLMVFDRDGKAFYLSEDIDKPLERSKQSETAYRHALKGESYFSGWVLSDICGMPALVFGAPVYSDSGQVVGVVITHYLWESLARLLETFDPRYIVHLLDEKGTIIASRETAEVGLNHPSAIDLQRLHDDIAKGYTLENDSPLHEGEPTFVIYVSSPESVRSAGLHWTLMMEQPLSVVLSPIKQMAWSFSLIIAAAIALFSLLYLIGTRRFIAPLNALKEGAEKVGEGNFQHTIAVTSKDELGQFAHSFNLMVNKLQQTTVTNNDLDRILNTMGDTLVVLSSRLHIIRANRTTLALLGYEDDELLGRSFLELLPNADTLLAPVLQPPHEKVIGASLYYTARDGSRTPVIFSASAILDSAGTLQSIVCAATDISEREKTQKALMASEERFRALVETTSDWIWEIDTEGRYTYASPQSEALLGYTPGELLGKTPFELMPPEEAKRVSERIMPILQNRRPFSLIENTNQHKNGSLITLESSGVPLFDASGNFVGYRGVDRNITQRTEAEKALRTSQQRFKQLADNINEVFWFLDRASGAYLFVSPAFETIWGFSEDQLYQVPQMWRNAVIPEDRERFDTAMKQLLSRKEEEFTIEYRIVTPEGKERWIRDHGSAVLDDAGQIQQLNGIASDITDYKHTQEQLLHQAYHDPLTGLANRDMLINTMEIELEHAKRSDNPLAVMFIDLDEFKLLNDTLGHHTGDELLIQVGKRIQQSLRKTDLLARQGGDEFIVLIPNRAQKEDNERFDLHVSAVAQRILLQFSHPFSIANQEVYTSASIGISIYPDDAEEIPTLLRFADSAMYRAKELGRSRFQFFSRELSEQHNTRLELVNHLHQAIEQKQFVLEYQPIVDLENGKMIGVEALVRWPQQDGSFIAPGIFIPVAEESGLILPISDWVLEEACRQIAKWHEEGVRIRTAVNLSVRQFWQENMSEHIIGIIRRSGIPRELIELEVTETAMVQETQRIESILNDLNDAGYKLSLDDFGTGYSSLNRLKLLPLSKLKIDLSFVSGIPDNRHDIAIVTTIVQLAENLGIPALAEGIENEEQWRYLKNLGCRYGQGYLFSQSLPPEKISELWRSGERWQLPRK